MASSSVYAKATRHGRDSYSNALKYVALREQSKRAMDSKILVNEDNINKLANLEKDLLNELFEGVSEVIESVQNIERKTDKSTKSNGVTTTQKEVDIDPTEVFEEEISDNVQ